MSDEVTADAIASGEEVDSGTAEFLDPRTLLVDWANANDEWARRLESEVIATGRAVSTSTIDMAYQFFRQEKALDKRELPAVEKFDIVARQAESAPPLSLTRLPNINTTKLGEIISKVTDTFEEACRCTDAHSQPLVTLGVSPKPAGPEQRWAELHELKKVNDGK